MLISPKTSRKAKDYHILSHITVMFPRFKTEVFSLTPIGIRTYSHILKCRHMQRKSFLGTSSIKLDPCKVSGYSRVDSAFPQEEESIDDRKGKGKSTVGS